MKTVAITDYTFADLAVEKSILDPPGCQVIGAMKRSRVIVRYGIGVDNVDLQATALRGETLPNVVNGVGK